MQDAIFKNSGRKRENRGAMPVTHFLFGAQVMRRAGIYVVFLARPMLQQRNGFLTLEHVLLGNGQREQPDVADEGAPGVGSGQRSLGWQWAVRLDHEVHSQQDQSQCEQALREKTGTRLMTLQ